MAEKLQPIGPMEVSFDPGVTREVVAALADAIAALAEQASATAAAIEVLAALAESARPHYPGRIVVGEEPRRRARG
ncbi:hypothetical protein ACFWGP_05520 [Agromyces sp. NPDC127015]|uniref:hypothetical protein n=1 Tax=Agromyces sp. NPDC127015 TaxID=3347108 RepID=UPI00365FF6CF